LSETTSKARWIQKLRDGLRHAFALEDPDGALTEEDRALLDRLAEKVVRRQMALPAVLLLQSVRPLSSLGSQAMVFLRPFLTPLLKPAVYDRMTHILDRREGVRALVDAIEVAEARFERSPLEP